MKDVFRVLSQGINELNEIVISTDFKGKNEKARDRSPALDVFTTE
jgi:hypothetical protein